jgi:hypothetical protein
MTHVNHHALRSFKQLTEEEKLVKSWAESDRQAKAVADIGAGVSKVEKTLASFPRSQKGGAPQAPFPKRGAKKAWVSCQVPDRALHLVERMSSLWNVPKSSVLRYALWILMEKYEFIEESNEILSKKDQRAVARDPRVRRPFTKRAESEGKLEVQGLQNSRSDNSKRPPSILNDLSG